MSHKRKGEVNEVNPSKREPGIVQLKEAEIKITGMDRLVEGLTGIPVETRKGMEIMNEFFEGIDLSEVKGSTITSYKLSLAEALISNIERLKKKWKEEDGKKEREESEVS